MLEVVEVGMSMKSGGAVPLHIHEEECATPSANGICLTVHDRATRYLRNFLREKNQKNVSDAAKVVEMVKKILGVSTESAIWEHPAMRDFVGEDEAKTILEEKYKPSGPAESVEWLNNRNIDSTLRQWSENSVELFGKKFCYFPCQMIDFEKVKSELCHLNIVDLVKEGCASFGVVLNTDTSDGRGKHWFGVYGDLDHAGTQKDPYSLEYFNSSGNPPMDQLSEWMEKTCHRLLRDNGKYCEPHRCVFKRLQHSNTECGMWSLLYIRSRLEGHEPQWFYTVNADDNDMIKMRKLLFRNT